MVVVYRGNELKYQLVRRFLLNLPHVSLVNILAEGEVVPELIGGAWTAADLADATLELLRDGRARKRCLAKLETLKKEFSARGASRAAARVILDAARGRVARNPLP
jgi:lipid-A-disaccharide synthase